jgi:thiol-disulfide isomerase/thioredoxin
LGGATLLIAILAGARLLMLRSFDNAPLPPRLEVIARSPVTLPDGRRAVIGDGLKPGVPTIVALWASWCGPCQQEAPHLAELRRRYGKEGLNLVYLNVRDPGASRSDLTSYMREHGLPPAGYAVLADDRIAALTNVPDRLIPRMLVYDRTGEPLGTVTGYNPFAMSRIAGLIAP